jgi:hypothetical protein
MSTHHSPERLHEDDFGFARSCICGWRGVLWTFKEGADRDYVTHVAREAAQTVGRFASVITIDFDQDPFRPVPSDVAPSEAWHRDK